MPRLSLWLRNSLARVTSSGQFIPQVDGLRFVAIAAVALFHMTGWLFPAGLWPQQSPGWAAAKFFVGKGYYGVELFFMISGFILALPMAQRHLRGDHHLNLAPYLKRRLTRLEPPYILNLLLFWLLWPQRPILDNAGNLAAGLVYAHGPIFGADNAINHVAWSLEVEVQFYLLAPFLAFVFAIASPLLRRGLILAAIAALLWLDRHQGLLPVSSHLYSSSLLGKGVFFLPGFLLADVYLTDWHARPRTSRLWDLTGLAAWAAIPLLLDLGGLAGSTVLVAQWLAFVSVFRGRLLSRLFSHPLLTVIGGMCYTIYLYHVCFIGTAGALVNLLLPQTAGWFLPRFLLLLTLTPALVLLASSALFLLIERPCMRKDWPARLLAWVRGFVGREDEVFSPPS